MSSRPLLLAFAMVCSSFSSGCLLDGGAYQSGGGSTTTSTSTSGGGGSGAGTSTSTTTGGAGGTTTTTTSSTTSSTTTTMQQCTTPADCGAPLPCQAFSCTASQCIVGNVQQGTFYANNDPFDCKMQVCDGQGHVVDANDDNEFPVPDNDPCHDLACSGGFAVQVPKNGGQPCGDPAVNPCSKGTCLAGGCDFQNLSDGSHPLGECGMVTCFSGSAQGTILSSALCPPDDNPNDCKIPECGPNGNNVPACYMVDAPENMACIRPNSQAGNCNASGQCCNNGGQSCN